jgi:hypothetical protein
MELEPTFLLKLKKLTIPLMEWNQTVRASFSCHELQSVVQEFEVITDKEKFTDFNTSIYL